MKRISRLIWAGWLLAGTVLAQSPVTLTIVNSPGFAIPADFGGLSFGAVAELPGHGGVSGCLFSPTNSQLVTLFKNSGLHHLRLGGSTVEGTNAAIPDHADIDSVFAFARTARVKVIYSLRLLNGNSAVAAADAGYIWKHYRRWLDCFAIGNEPDIKRYHYPPFGTGSDQAITNYTSYLAVWRKFAAAVTNAAPGATFAGPDAANQSWASRFAADEKNSGLLSVVTQHFYAGGGPFVGAGPATIPPQEAIGNMLSTNWVEGKYPEIFHKALAPVVAEAWPYRMTEANDYLKGVAHASDAFASALWALDFMHWWAAHGCSGVNFHNTEWLKTDTIYLDQAADYQIHPKAYGIKAFDVGGRGRVEPVTIADTNGLDLTAYAVVNRKDLCVTIINKEHGVGARDAMATLSLDGFAMANAAAMFLVSTSHDAEATNGIILGGASITNNARWRGQWMRLEAGSNNQCTVVVPATSAVIVKIKTE